MEAGSLMASDWRDTARELVRILPDERIHDWLDPHEDHRSVRSWDTGILWAYEDRVGWPDYIPDLTDDATAGVLLGMLAALYEDVECDTDWSHDDPDMPGRRWVVRWANPFSGQGSQRGVVVADTVGHAVALALLEVH